MRKMHIAGLLAMSMASGLSSAPNRVFVEPRKPKNYPRMLTSSPREIAEHNKNVSTRQVLRRIARKGA